MPFASSSSSSSSSSSFISVSMAVLTVSDSRTLANDVSGDTLVARITKAGHSVKSRKLVQDNQKDIVTQLRQWIKDPAIQVVISTGGTGLTARDITPEAFRSVYEKEIEGFALLFHHISYASIGTSTVQSRATAGLAGGTYLFALPGSPSACVDAWDNILCQQLDARHRPCNFVDLMPRL